MLLVQKRNQSEPARFAAQRIRVSLTQSKFEVEGNARCFVDRSLNCFFLALSFSPLCFGQVSHVNPEKAKPPFTFQEVMIRCETAYGSRP